MNRFLRGLALLLVSTGLLPSFAPVPAWAFSDVRADTQYGAAIDALQTKGVLQGYSDGSFKPGATINRAEFLKIILNGRSGSVALSTMADGDCFPDVHTEWFAPYVCEAKTEGIIEGYPDGSFHPEQDISFVEASKILALAYKQQIQNQGGDWYMPYAQALESSKAIPTTIIALDAKLTRGEMAEMMWRLSAQKTDQPAKALVNIEHPELSLNMASDNVQTANNCIDLQAFAQTATQMHMGGRGGIMMQDQMKGAVAAPMAAQSNGALHAYSQTNVQVAGVDEADIVKTDGVNVYALSNQASSLVRIVRADPANQMKVLSTIDLGKQNMTATELYIENGKLILIGPQMTAPSSRSPMPMTKIRGGIVPGDYFPGNYAQRTAVKIFDVSDGSNPKLLRTLAFDGSEISSRRIGSKTYLVLRQPMTWTGPIPLSSDTSVVPQYQDSLSGKTKAVAPCNRVAILPRVPSPQYLMVAAIRTDDIAADVKTTAVLGNGDNVYASLDNLYVGTTEWKYVWNVSKPESNEKTHLYRFAFDDNGVTFKAQGSVPGHVLNQYSMDENGTTFRVATTGSDISSMESVPTNNLYILNLDLAQVGAIEKIAPGETIYAARFMGDRAYLVTFNSIDPLFVIDTSDARNPKILGQLKIPGFSNHLQPYDATHLIGFGKDVDASIDADKVHTPGAVYYTAVQGFKMSLFDVSDVTKPVEMYKTVIGDRGTDSPILQDPKALFFEQDRNLLAFPILVTKKLAGADASADGIPVFQGAYVYTVSLDTGFTLKGTVTQYTDPSVFQKAGSYWYNGGQDIERVVRINDSLMSVSAGGVQRNALSNLQQEGSVSF